MSWFGAGEGHRERRTQCVSIHIQALHVIIALTVCLSNPIAYARDGEAPASLPAASDLSLERIPSTTRAARPSAASRPVGLAGLTLDQLLNTEVTLVSRNPERLGETPSSIQVITNEEIRRSGAVTLPEALRLATNLQVAQIDAHDWAISARGFNGAPTGNNALSNKLLVMIDGRTVYSPLFGGVLWDVQNVLLEDVDRIEVISGPGSTLWGSNAVNGVINVVTKSAKETQGLYLSALGGTFWQEYGAARYGGQINDNTFYRVYGLGFQHDNTFYPNGNDVNDEWQLAQSGFRIDSYPTRQNTLTFQGDIYGSQNGSGNFFNPTGAPGPDFERNSGGNLLGRWTHAFSKDSDLIVQTYFDGCWRDVPLQDFGFAVRTYDIDIQHRFPLGDRQSITWGGGYRLVQNSVTNATPISFLPAKRTLNLYDLFIQDEITLVPDHWKLTLGTKVEHNDYTDFELEPSARLAWTPDDRNTLWAAVSRAVRSPTRFDSDTLTPTFISPDDFQSEKLTAYELGYRVRPVEPLSLSVATFYNVYQDVRSVNSNPAGPRPITLGNDQQADSWGVELSGDLQLLPWWRLRGGYTYFGKNIWATDPAVIPISSAIEGIDPHNQVLIQSMMDLPEHFQFDMVGRYVDSVPLTGVSDYFSLDVRVAWHYRNLELALVGQNLLDNRHPEFGPIQIPRSFYGQLTLRW